MWPMRNKNRQRDTLSKQVIETFHCPIHGELGRLQAGGESPYEIILFTLEGSETKFCGYCYLAFLKKNLPNLLVKGA